jgi:hypothetical protein
LTEIVHEHAEKVHPAGVKALDDLNLEVSEGRPHFFDLARGETLDARRV